MNTRTKAKNKRPLIQDDLLRCPVCGRILKRIWENNGFSEPNGPSHYEITSLKCSCGYEE